MNQKFQAWVTGRMLGPEPKMERSTGRGRIWGKENEFIFGKSRDFGACIQKALL